MAHETNSDTSLRYRGAAARRAALVRLINELGFCTVTDLTERLGVSRMTVRRDIQQLEEEQLVRGAHGGVAALAPRTGGTDFQLRRHQQAAEKRAIGRRAVERLYEQHADSAIGIDAGTSAYEVAAQFHPDRRCTVVTHSLPNMNELAERPNVETSAVRDGVMYCGNAFDAVTKRELMRIADETILLMDSSKFTKTATFDIEELRNVDAVLVDAGATEAQRRMLGDAVRDVIVVPTDAGD
jgi:DeoR/GlpR family transcriptional regulator of sugar metabolism